MKLATANSSTTSEAKTAKGAVCRFFGREGWCDVGGPDSSVHDVETMVRFCNGRHQNCSRYTMLAEKWSGMAPSPKEPPRISPRPTLRGAASSEVARGVLQHELRTPLTAIMSSAEILAAHPDRDSATRQKFVNIILEETRRLKKTVEALFDGLEAGVEPEEVKAPLEFERKEVQQEYQTKGREKMSKNSKGWTVALAGTGINLALGILYAWSIFKGAIKTSIEKGGEFNWDLASINDPYAVCCLVFAVAMIIAGRVQDRFGPRLTALVGGLLVGAGFILVSTTTSYWMWVLGFGGLAGMGIGFGYCAATPPALKWFPPAKTGVIAGIVVSGFGLASVYIAPLSNFLLNNYGVQKSMLIYGIAFTAVVSALSMLLVNPPKGYVPEGSMSSANAAATKKAAATVDATPSQIIRTVPFYTLWTAFFVGSGAGLMVIGSISGMAKASMGEMAFLAVALMAIGNAAGRIVAGMLSDKIGRANTLFIMMATQAALMFVAIPVVGSKSPSAIMLVLLATAIGFNYGTNLSLFPSFAKDLWGLKNFGINYGALFTAWGIGGFVMGRVSEMLKATTGSFDLGFITAGVLLMVGAALTLTLRDKKVKVVSVEEAERVAKAA
jgi:MFS family permease